MQKISTETCQKKKLQKGNIEKIDTNMTGDEKNKLKEYKKNYQASINRIKYVSNIHIKKQRQNK